MVVVAPWLAALRALALGVGLVWGIVDPFGKSIASREERKNEAE